jgi:beta-glucosidase-like glycosyl hydrolase
VDCGAGYAATVPAGLQDGSINERDVDRALNRTLGQLISLGLANVEPPAPWGALDEHDIDTPGHRSLAKDAAMQGFVLLKNEGGLLPLKQAAVAEGERQKLKVAAIGPHLNSSTHLLANYCESNDSLCLS